MRRLLLIASSVAALHCGGSGVAKGEEPVMEETSLQVTLAEAPSGAAGEVNLTFTVTSDQEHRFCIYHTPMESFAGNILEVIDTASGERVQYTGRIKKRGPPREEHYVTVLPDHPQSATFDLARYYRVAGGGSYTVQFRGNPHMNGLPDSNVLELSVP